MTIPSNLYADKMFAKHPTALWSLDDVISGTPSTIPEVSLELDGVPAISYGINQYPAYYVANSLGNICAINDGIPMVNGATNNTTIYYNDKGPSLLFPAFGFMNNLGRYRTITFEAWIKINSEAISAKKIIGPINSDDGLYVYGAFLVFKFDGNIKSYFIGEWARPMLLNIIFSETSATVLINAEQVIDFRINHETANFANGLNGNDWIGIYAHEDVDPINIDCVAIYPYAVASADVKIRLVYGQAVQSPEMGALENSDVPVIIDYQFSKYAMNYAYPDMSKWSNAILDNLSTNNNLLSVPKYTLPSINFSIKETLNNWYLGQENVQIETTEVDRLESNDLFIKMDPFESGYQANIYFNNFNCINDSVAGFYGVFYSEVIDKAETLFKIDGKSGQSFLAKINVDEESITGYSLSYIFIGSNGQSTTVFSEAIDVNEKFAAGINIGNFINSTNNKEIKTFFSNKISLSITIGGTRNLTETFSGRIYRFGFLNSPNMSQISSYFNLDGYIEQDKSILLLDHYASYTLFAVNTFGKYELDIAVGASWKDYMPVSYFAKQVYNSNDVLEQDIDFIQFNIDFPEPHRYISESSFETSEIDTTDSIVKTFVRFSEIAEKDTYDIDIPLTYGKTVFPYDDWKIERYEVVNESLIYLPRYVESSVLPDPSFKNLRLNYYIEFKIPGILRNPVAIRSLHFGSRALNHTIKTEIGTRFGKDIHPYIDFNGVKNYKEINPVAIYTGSSTYMYLTKYSGISVAGDTSQHERGVMIPINKDGDSHYHISLIQFAIKTEDLFPANPIKIFELEDNAKEYYGYLERTDSTGKIARLFMTYQKRGESEQPFYDADIYVNGVKFFDSQDSDLLLDNDPIIRYKEWNLIGIKFKTPVELDNYTAGYLSLIGPFTFNNINNYKLTKEQEGLSLKFNYWSDILGPTGSENLWSDYISVPPAEEITWQDVKVSQDSGIPGLDGSKTYNTFFGLNRITIDSSNMPLQLKSYEYDIFKDIVWQTNTTSTV